MNSSSINRLHGNFEKISTKYIMPLSSSKPVESIIALVSAVSIVAIAIIFNQLALTLLVSIPIAYVTMIYIKKKFQIDGFNACKSQIDMLKVLSELCVGTVGSRKNNGTAEDISKEKQEINIEETFSLDENWFSDFNPFIKKMISFVELLQKHQGPIKDLKSPLLNVQTALNQLDQMNNQENQENLNQTLLELIKNIENISTKIEENAECIWPLEKENRERYNNLGLLRRWTDSCRALVLLSR